MTEPIDVPTGAHVRVQVPIPPTVSVPSPEPSGVVILPVPGPPGTMGPAGDGGFSYSQPTPSSTWVIANTLGRYPSSVTVWIDDELVVADISINTSTDEIVVEFGSAQTGRVEVI